MVDHLSDLNFMHLKRSTIHEENLSGKPAFEIWADTFGVNIKIHHAENGIFSEQPFGSLIEVSNQTITSLGFGPHHQNSIVERKIQTLKLGDRTLIINVKNIGQRQ